MPKVEDIAKSVIDYLFEYIREIAVTLREPRLLLRTVGTAEVIEYKDGVPVARRDGSTVELKHVEYHGSGLDRSQASYLGMHIFIGHILYYVADLQHASGLVSINVMLTSLIVVGIYWVVFGCILHVAAVKFLNGTGSLQTSVTTVIQLLALVFVVGSLATFLWSNLVQWYGLVQSMLGLDFAWLPLPWMLHSLLDLLNNQPIQLYYIIQYVMAVVYIPILFRYIHGFGLQRQLAIAGVVMVLGILLRNANTFIQALMQGS